MISLYTSKPNIYYQYLGGKDDMRQIILINRKKKLFTTFMLNNGSNRPTLINRNLPEIFQAVKRKTIESFGDIIRNGEPEVSINITGKALKLGWEIY